MPTSLRVVGSSSPLHVARSRPGGGRIARLQSFLAGAVVSCFAATSSLSAVPERPTTFAAAGAWPTELFHAAVMEDLAGANQLAALHRLIAKLNDSQQTTLRDLLLAAKTPVERVFILKALVAGQPWDRVVEYAIAIRGVSPEEIVARSTVRGQQPLPQRWHYSCGPAVAQVAIAELDPIAAWRLNEEARRDATASIRTEQQREWLEQYGGIATPRGDTSGRGLSLVALLNDKLGRISGATYACHQIASMDDALSEIARILRTGYDVPLCLSWAATESATSADNHFVLALSVRGWGDDTEFQIYEPSTGKTQWIAATALRRNSLQPIIDTPVLVTHYYEPSPLHADQPFMLASAAAR